MVFCVCVCVCVCVLNCVVVQNVEVLREYEAMYEEYFKIQPELDRHPYHSPDVTFVSCPCNNIILGDLYHYHNNDRYHSRHMKIWSLTMRS